MISSPNSYFTAEEAKIISEPTFIITLGGSYEVPQEDILDPGSCNISRSTDFSDIVSGGHTFILRNYTNIYSPGHSDFIFYGTTWWRKSLKIELGYKRSGYQGVIDKITIFEGLITNWITKEDKDYAQDSPSQGIVAEITSSDHVSLLIGRQIATPDDDGTPHPLPYGTLFKDLIELKDGVLWTPDKSESFEPSGNWGNITPVTANGGTCTMLNTGAYDGTYNAKCLASSATNNDKAYLEMDAGDVYSNVLITFMIKFVNPPSMGVNQDLYFVQMINGDGNCFLELLVYADGLIWVHDYWSGGSYQTSYSIYSMINWTRMSLIYSYTQSAWRVFVNGDCISERAAQMGNNFRKTWVGVCQLYTEDLTWDIRLDKFQMSLGASHVYPYCYYLPGKPYTAINNIWQDGALLPQQARTWEGNLPYINSLRDQWKIQANARTFPYDQWNAIPSLGAVNINPSYKGSGNIFAEMVHDTTTHPADIISALLTEAGLSSYIDSDNIDDVKTAMPNDVIGALFDNTNVAQAISDITGLMLYDVVPKSGKLIIIPYAGEPLDSSVMTLNRSNCFSIEQNFSMDNIKTGVTVKWGWYEKDNSLFYRHDNTTLKSTLGDMTEPMDLSYGSSVSTKDGTTATAKADLMLKRLGGAIDTITAKGNLSLARLELGDGVLVQCEFNSSDLIYEVIEKVVDMTNKIVEVKVARYQGEA